MTVVSCVLATGFAAGAGTYYVDATRGDDARDGIKPASAWRTLARVNRAALSPGDSVLFCRGETFRGQLAAQSGNAAGVITYGAYGDGPKPVLLGSVAADRAEDWVPAGEGLWATAPLRFDPVGVPMDLQGVNWTLHQESGAACSLTREKAGADGKATLRLACRQSGTKRNHIQLSTAGLPVEEGEYYLLMFRARATQPFAPAGVSVMTSSPPYTAYASVDAGLPVIGTNWTDCAIRMRGRQSAQNARLTIYFGGTLPADGELFLQPGQWSKARCNQLTPLSADVGNIIFDHGKSTGMKKWHEADLRQEGDYLYDARTWQVKLRCNGNPAARYRSIELALRKHIIDEGGRGYVVYENLDLRYGAAHGIGGGSTHHITARGLDISFIGGGHQFTRPDGKPVRFGNGIEFWSSASDCLVEDCRIWEIYDAALTNQGDGTNVQQNITYRRNVIWNSEYSFEFWNRGPASLTRNIVFEHNTCVDAGRGWGYRQRPDPNGRHLMFYSNTAVTTNVVVRYNIFCDSADSCLRLHGQDWTAVLTMDYNCWFQAGGPLVLWGKETIGADAFAGFMGGHNLDAHSLVAQPKFVNAAQRDYRLAPDSPARALSNNGKPVGALP